MRDDIIRMAREAGFGDADLASGVWITDGYWDKELERFARLVELAFIDKLSANTSVVRQIMDAGLLSSHPGGFKERKKE